MRSRRSIVFGLFSVLETSWVIHNEILHCRSRLQIHSSASSTAYQHSVQAKAAFSWMLWRTSHMVRLKPFVYSSTSMLRCKALAASPGLSSRLVISRVSRTGGRIALQPIGLSFVIRKHLGTARWLRLSNEAWVLVVLTLMSNHWSGLWPHCWFHITRTSQPPSRSTRSSKIWKHHMLPSERCSFMKRYSSSRTTPMHCLPISSVKLILMRAVPPSMCTSRGYALSLTVYRWGQTASC